MQEGKIYKLLQCYGIKTPKNQSFSPNEEIDVNFYPIALKIESSKVVHKSDVGGVILRINSKQEANEAKNKIIQNLLDRGVVLDENDKFIATQMVFGEEFFVGSSVDPVFSTVILFGRGGIYLEIDKDICYIDLNSDRKEILNAFGATKISKLFPQFRGKTYDIEDVVELIGNFQKLLKENPNIQEIDLNPVIYSKDGFIAVDARVKFETFKPNITQKRDRADFFKNQTVAILGVSQDSSKVGYAIAKNSLNAKSEVFFVGKKGGEIFGKTIYTAINSLPKAPDTVILSIPSSQIFDSIKEAATNFGTKNFVVISAGFKEAGDLNGEEKIKNLADEMGLNIVRPNCLGIYNSNFDLNLTFATDRVLRGSTALISQSGAVLSAVMDMASSFDEGFSHIVSLGNMCDLTFSDLVEFLNNEDSCKNISIYAEGISNGQDFLNAIRKSKKPIYLFKVGMSEQSKKAAFSHTGNLSGNYESFVSLLKNMGVIIEKEIDALYLAPKFSDVKNVLILTNAGGPAAILADYLSQTRVKLFELEDRHIDKLDAILPSNWSKNNPVDIIGDAMSQRYEDTLKVIDDFEDLDLIFMLVTPQFMTDIENIASLAAKGWNKKIVPILLGGQMFDQAKKVLQDNRILYFDSLKKATSFL